MFILVEVCLDRYIMVRTYSADASAHLCGCFLRHPYVWDRAGEWSCPGRYLYVYMIRKMLYSCAEACRIQSTRTCREINGSACVTWNATRAVFHGHDAVFCAGCQAPFLHMHMRLNLPSTVSRNYTMTRRYTRRTQSTQPWRQLYSAEYQHLFLLGMPHAFSWHLNAHVKAMAQRYVWVRINICAYAKWYKDPFLNWNSACNKLGRDTPLLQQTW